MNIIDTVTEYMYCNWGDCCMKEITWDELQKVRNEIKDNAMDMIKANLDINDNFRIGEIYMQKLYTLTSDEVESLSFYQQSIRTTASYIGKLIDKIEDGETHTEKIKYKIDEIISYTKHINDILAEK